MHVLIIVLSARIIPPVHPYHPPSLCHLAATKLNSLHFKMRAELLCNEIECVNITRREPVLLKSSQKSFSSLKLPFPTLRLDDRLSTRIMQWIRYDLRISCGKRLYRERMRDLTRTIFYHHLRVRTKAEIICRVAMTIRSPTEMFCRSNYFFVLLESLAVACLSVRRLVSILAAVCRRERSPFFLFLLRHY